MEKHCTTIAPLYQYGLIAESEIKSLVNIAISDVGKKVNIGHPYYTVYTVYCEYNKVTTKCQSRIFI